MARRVGEPLGQDSVNDPSPKARLSQSNHRAGAQHPMMRPPQCNNITICANCIHCQMMSIVTLVYTAI
eukprot:193518-Hanusia_phi.AAC.1